MKWNGYILSQEASCKHLNVSQSLDLLSQKILEDIDLKMTLSNCMGLRKRPYYSPPWWGQFAWFVIFAIMLLLAVIGNTLVIWYVTIVKPLQHRLSRRVARLALFSVWCSSALLALPSLLYSDTYTKKYINGEREICFIKWPDGSYPISKTDYCYNLVFLSVTYVLSMSVMVWAYGRMSRTLRGHAIGECTHHQMQIVRAKRKIVRMFVFVVMVFALCWLPYHAFFVLVYHHQSLASAPFGQHIYLGFYWLAMANSMFNPLIYYWMSKKFRVYFRGILCWCQSVKNSTPDHTTKQFEMKKSISVSQKNFHGTKLCMRA